MRFTAAALLVLFSCAEASGQDLWPVTLEATAGLGTGHSAGEYKENRIGLAADVLLGGTVSSSWMFAVDVSMQGAGPYESDCRPRSTGGCIPSWPEFFSAAAMLGYERTHGLSLRVLLGPAYVSAEETRTTGVRGRFDFAVPVVWHVGMTGSFRVTLIPDYRGDSFRLFAFGVGLRVR